MCAGGCPLIEVFAVQNPGASSRWSWESGVRNALPELLSWLMAVPFPVPMAWA